MTARKKRRRTTLRFRKDDPEHNLLAAVQHYVEAKGGSAVVIGGIQVEHWPLDEIRYRVSVGCTGRRPSAKTADAGVAT